MTIKVSRSMFPGSRSEYMKWASTIAQPYRSMIETEDTVTRREAIDIGYAVFRDRSQPLTEVDKHFLVELFYEIMKDDHPA